MRCDARRQRGPRLVSMQWVDSSTVLLPSLCEHDFSPEDEFDTLCYQTPLMYVRMVEHEDSAGQRVTEWLPSSVRVVRFRRPHRRSGHQERLNPTLRPSCWTCAAACQRKSYLHAVLGHPHERVDPDRYRNLKEGCSRMRNDTARRR
jgi:hypothetical protein